MSIAIDTVATMTQPARTGSPKSIWSAIATAQDFGHGGGDGREVGAGKHRAPNEAGKVTCRGLGKTGARGDTQVCRVVLQHNEHDRGQRDDPQQRVAKLRAGGHVGGPVARIDKADGHEQPGADMPGDIQTSVACGAVRAKVMFEMVEHGALLRAVCLTSQRIPVLGLKVNQD